jgi:hypothetical protein
MNNTNTTLFGGRKAPVQFNDGRTEEITIRQLALRDYEKAFAVLDDEMALTALICGREKAWLLGSKEDGSDGITTDCYEALQVHIQEVNAKGFFVWSRRRAAKARQQMQENAALMAAMPPEAMRAAIEAGTKPLPTSSPASVPRPR